MKRANAKDQLLDHALAIDAAQFEQLCKMVIERAEETRDLELTPFRGDGGIDIQAVIDRQLFHARLGVQAKQFSASSTVGAPAIQRFKGALLDQEYHIGTVITTSRFTSGAVDSAARSYIRLIDGDRLAEIMLESEVGIVETAAGCFDRDNAFWALFEKPEDSDLIPSIEVPQADNFETLRMVLRAIDAGNDVKPEIATFIENETGNSFDSRQADYYGMAAWLLGFVHKEERKETESGKVRRWGLTREGEEMVEYLRRGDDETAKRLMVGAIRDVEIIRRIYERLEDAGLITRGEIAEVLAEESELSGSTIGRRARSVGNWLAELPEVQRVDADSDPRYEIVPTDPSHFSS